MYENSNPQSPAVLGKTHTVITHVRPSQPRAHQATRLLISTLGSQLRQSHHKEELVQFFFFSVGFAEATQTLNSDIQCNLQTEVTNVLCLGGLSRTAAALQAEQMLNKTPSFDNNQAQSPALVPSSPPPPPLPLLNSTDSAEDNVEFMNELLGLC